MTIIERGSFTDGCSYGNAGMIVPSHIVPLAQPGMISKGMRWMLDAQSPFYVKPRLSGDLVKWGYLFWKNATEKHVRYAIPHLRDLSLLSKELYQDLADEPGFSFGWKEKGLLMLFKNAATRHEMEEEARTANQSGIEAQLLSVLEVQALEPDVHLSVEGAVFYPGDAQIYPNQLIADLVSFLRKSGVGFVENQVVEDFVVQNHKIETISTNGGSYTFDEVVVAAGAWSPILTHKLGLSLPLQGGKGYSFLAGSLTNQMQIPAIMLEARTTATPMAGGVRFAGTLEIAGTDESVNMNRVRGIHNSIQQYYPDIEVAFPEKEDVWSGLRPCSPDGLPYLGRVKGFENLILATGHGMMGVSMGPATGKLVAEIVAGRNTSVNVEAFEPRRF